FADMVMPGGLMAKLTAWETVPSGFDTAMLALPTAAIRLAGTAALNCAALENVVDSGEPFHCTAAPERKPAPVTASVKAGPPTVVELGASDVITGTATTPGGGVPEATPIDGTTSSGAGATGLSFH